MKEKKKGIGDQYQQETKYCGTACPAVFLTGTACRRGLKNTLMPGRRLNSLHRSRTGEPDCGRYFTSGARSGISALSPLALKDLSQLVFATQGATAKAGGYVLRTAPSAGALYPVETYVAVNRVESLVPGLYHFNVVPYCLELLQEGDVSPALCRAGLGQTMVMECAAVFIWTAVVARSKWKYRERAYRYIYMDAGHIGENLYLAAAALKLGCCTIGAFYDEEVNAVLGIDGVSETAVYMGVVGRCV